MARRAADLNPESAEALYVLGRALDRLGKTDEAIQTLRDSIRIGDRFAESHYLLSRIFLKLGKTAEAEKELQLFKETKRLVKPMQ